VKLLLDELYAKRIAEQLRGRGHDAVSVKERPELEGLRDEELFSRMAEEQRAILTENWADYDRLLGQAVDTGTIHYGVVFTSRRHLPRSRDTIGLFVRELDDFLRRHPTVDALLNSSRWLPDRVE
jgi:predicted nuclease of predicted toxin-antitoxin system